MPNRACAPYVRSPSLPDCERVSAFEAVVRPGCAAAIAALHGGRRRSKSSNDRIFRGIKSAVSSCRLVLKGLLTELGCGPSLKRLRPARIGRMLIRAGRTEKIANYLRQHLG